MWQILKTDCFPPVYVSALQQAKMAKLFLRKMEMGRKKLQVDKMRMDMQKRSVPSPHLQINIWPYSDMIITARKATLQHLQRDWMLMWDVICGVRQSGGAAAA
jgi:hypothetical protein